jgi:hypothetical protein
MKDPSLSDRPLKDHKPISIPGPVKSIEQLKQELEALKAWKLEQATAPSTYRPDRH